MLLVTLYMMRLQVETSSSLVLVQFQIQGDGSGITGIASGLTATIGIKSEGSFIGSGITQIDFSSTNGTATQLMFHLLHH